MSGRGSPHDLEIKAPEPLHTDDIKPEDSKSSVGSTSHASSHGGSTTASKLGKDGAKESGETKDEGKNALGETPEEEIIRVCKRLCEIVDPVLDRIKPILDMINDKVEKAERTDKEELDEDRLVEDLKPLIERGTSMLQETAGMIKAVDPHNKISNAAQHRAKNNEATPEEQHLAQTLATLAGDVTKTIERAKELIKDMPHAKNKLGPLLDMFGEPLFQILSAVGLLLNGVLTLVANLLDALGLGGIVRGVLNGLGISKLLNGIGLGKWLEK